MSNTTPHFGDSIYDLVFKANLIVQPLVTSGFMTPRFGDSLYDLVYKLDQNLNGITGGGGTIDFENLDLSSLPTSDPGGGKPWLNGGVVQVGP